MPNATDGCVVEVLSEQWARRRERISLEAAARALAVEFQRPVLSFEERGWRLVSGFVNGARVTDAPLEVGDVLEPHAPFTLHGRCWRLAGVSDPLPAPPPDGSPHGWQVFEDWLLEQGIEPPSRARGRQRMRLLGGGAPLVATGEVRVTFDERGWVATVATEAARWPVVTELLRGELLFQFVEHVALLGALPADLEAESVVARARELAFPRLRSLRVGLTRLELEDGRFRLRPPEPPPAWTDPAVLLVTRQGHTRRHGLSSIDTVWRQADGGIAFSAPGVPEAMPLLVRQRGRWTLQPGREPFLRGMTGGILRHDDRWTLADGTELCFLQFPE